MIEPVYIYRDWSFHLPPAPVEIRWTPRPTLWGVVAMVLGLR